MMGPDIYCDVLGNLEDGVPVADLDEPIETLNPKALSMSLTAVESHGSAHRLRVADPQTGDVEEHEVEIGRTARASVEIRQGLTACETVLGLEG